MKQEIDYKRVKNIAKELSRLSRLRDYDSIKRKCGLKHLLIPSSHILRTQPGGRISALLGTGSPMWKVRGVEMKDTSVQQ